MGVDGGAADGVPGLRGGPLTSSRCTGDRERRLGDVSGEASGGGVGLGSLTLEEVLRGGRSLGADAREERDVGALEVAVSRLAGVELRPRLPDE